MGNTPFSGARYTDGSEAASVRIGTTNLAQSVDDKWIGKFANSVDMNAALNALPSASRPGSVAWLAGVGWYGWDGASWRQDLQRRVFYDQSKTYSSLSPGLDLPLGSWPASAGFTSDASGILVTEAGVYSVQIVVVPSGAAFNGRSYVALNASGNQSQFSISPNEVRGTATGLFLMGAGNLLTPYIGHNAAIAIGLTARMTICRVAM